MLDYDVEAVVADSTMGSSSNPNLIHARAKHIDCIILRLKELFSEAGAAHNNGNGGSRKKPRLSIQPTSIHQHLRTGKEDNNIFNMDLSKQLDEFNTKNWEDTSLEQKPDPSQIQQAMNEHRDGDLALTWDNLGFGFDEEEE